MTQAAALPDAAPVPMPELPPSDLVQRVAEVYFLTREHQGNDLLVAQALDWTMDELNRFKRDNSALLDYAAQVQIENPDQQRPPTDIEVNVTPEEASTPQAPPTTEEVARMVERADFALSNGLRAIGLTEEEAVEAEAMQKFNASHFKSSMDIVSTNLMRTGIKSAVQQRFLEERLKFVRTTLAGYGEFASEERTGWVLEENKLMMQWVEVGRLLKDIHEAWYKGAGTLALIKMKMGERQGTNKRTQRTGKPAFRPTIHDQE